MAEPLISVLLLGVDDVCRLILRSNSKYVALLQCLFDSMRPSQQFFSYVGTGLPRLNQH